MAKRKLTQVEKRLAQGARLLLTRSNEPGRAEIWTYSDNGKSARADTCHKLLESGVLVPERDGLFPDDSQSFSAAVAQ